MCGSGRRASWFMRVTLQPQRRSCHLAPLLPGRRRGSLARVGLAAVLPNAGSDIRADGLGGSTARFRRARRMLSSATAMAASSSL